MKIAVTGHTKGLGKSIYDHFEDSIGFSRSNGFDITNEDHYPKILEQVKFCDVFINCATDRFGQTELLFYIAHFWKGKIINIGSQAKNSVLSGYGELCNPYSVELNVLAQASKRLFNNGLDSTIISFGDLENLDNGKDTEKLPHTYCVELIEWVIKQPYRIAQLDVEPAWKE